MAGNWVCYLNISVLRQHCIKFVKNVFIYFYNSISMRTNDIKTIIIRRLVQWRKWGGSHTENIISGLPAHLRGEKITKRAIKEMVRDEWLLPAMTKNTTARTLAAYLMKLYIFITGSRILSKVYLSSSLKSWSKSTAKTAGILRISKSSNIFSFIFHTSPYGFFRTPPDCHICIRWMQGRTGRAFSRSPVGLYCRFHSSSVSPLA